VCLCRIPTSSSCLLPNSQLPACDGEQSFTDCFDRTLASVKNGIVPGSIELDDLDKILAMKEAMGMSQGHLWNRLGMKSRMVVRREIDRHNRSWTAEPEASQRRIQMAYNRVRMCSGDQRSRSPKLDDMEFVRRIDARECANAIRTWIRRRWISMLCRLIIRRCALHWSL
jgi:hypothetical protein